MKKLMHILLLSAFSGVIVHALFAGVNDTIPSLEDIFQLLRRGMERNTYHAKVEMKIIRDAEEKTFTKEVWADFPKYYREEFEKKPDSPELSGWMKRRHMFFPFGPGHFPRPRGFPPGRPPGDMPPGDEIPRRVPPDAPPGEFGNRPRPGDGFSRDNFSRRINRAFNPVIGDGESVAGRAVFRVTMEPRNLPRPRIVFWVDKEYGTILQVEFYRYESEQWILRYTEYFLSIEYNPVFPDNTFTEDDLVERHLPRRHPPEHVRADVQELSDPAEIGASISFPYSIPANIPEGFALERIRVVKGEMGELLHIHYSDGVYAFSIFQSAGELPLPPLGSELDGRNLKSGEIRVLHREGRTVLLKRVPPVNFVLIGNCPETIVMPVIEKLGRE